MSIVEDPGSPVNDRAENEGRRPLDSPRRDPPVLPAGAMQRRTPSQILTQMPSVSNSDAFHDEETPRYKYQTFSARPHLAAAPSVLQEVPNMILLAVLYMLQGVPLGLTMGTLPMLLASKASYTQIGLFSVAAYPYSFKLLWSPIVDSIYFRSFGRRKSWLVPLQLLSAILMASFAPFIEAHVEAADVPGVTALFFCLVLLAATQDIAVDGWALTLLSRRHVGYASTCQTVGMNLGYFTSITVFLALSDPDFCNRYLRGPAAAAATGAITLGGYLRLWAVAYVVVTVAVALFKRERPPPLQSIALPNGVEPPDDSIESLATAYSQLWSVVKLPAVVRLSGILVVCRLAFLCAESAASLKLIEKGVPKDTLASLVIVQFPCELASAVIAGRWAAAGSPFLPWQRAYLLRTAAGAAMTITVMLFPADATTFSAAPASFAALTAASLLTSFSSTLMFTAMGTFFNRISDPDMGGAYLTMLNTIMNIGITLPQVGVFALVDALSANACMDPSTGQEIVQYACPRNTQTAKQANECTEGGGVCHTIRDGFYITSLSALALGLPLFLHFRRALPRLEALPLDSWRSKTVDRQV